MEKVSPIKICEVILNTLNHVMIGAVSLYMTYLCCVQVRYSIFNMHVLVTTLGFQLLMAESIMVYYSNNTWSNLLTRTTKNHIHWITQVLGSGMALVGIGLEYYRRGWVMNWRTNHDIYGWLSAIVLIINLFIGIAALYAGNLRYIIRPVITKFCHNFLGLLTFFFGIASLYFGYYTGFMRRNSTEEIVGILVGFTIATTILSSIGALKELNHQGQDVLKLFVPKRPSEERKKENLPA